MQLPNHRMYTCCVCQLVYQVRASVAHLEKVIGSRTEGPWIKAFQVWQHLLSVRHNWAYYKDQGSQP